ncbi:MAG: UDP-3-O-(3-hydroxymyristoyl)glucosamine N-acyltransferase [Alphaproteobacteria bacterium]|nr:UDP-3-O-(3-hydroxymyristoyl)glucosamine N-acyltransferase [Alphaproteobacteria bacterium]
MADPRFYDNRGPFTLAEVCARAGVAAPDRVDASAAIADVASLSGAAASHLAFFTGGRASEEFGRSLAGFCFVPAKGDKLPAIPAGLVIIPCDSPQHAFAAVAQLFYPEALGVAFPQALPIDPMAEIGIGVDLAPGVVVGPGAQIGEGVRIGPNVVIGRGVTVGRGTEIGANVSIAYAHIGDGVQILPGAQIGQPGFGFASSPRGHVKIPQLGRVIIQDRVEIGACVTIDRGALGDTVVGEGTKIDNLVQIGHNVHVGRHCVIVSQVGISGSSTLGDYVVIGGQGGIADHCYLGDGARLAGRGATAPGQVIEAGKDYGGVPAKPIKEWMREVFTLAALARKPKRGGND